MKKQKKKLNNVQQAFLAWLMVQRLETEMFKKFEEALLTVDSKPKTVNHRSRKGTKKLKSN